MQIGGLNYANNAATIPGANNVATIPGAKTAQKAGGKFNALLMALQDMSGQKTQEFAIGIKDSKISLKDLKELLSFLKNNQLLDLKDGLGLQDKLLSNPDVDILKLVKDYFGLSDVKWSQILHSLSASIKGKGEPVVDIAADSSKQKDEKEINDGQLADIMNLLSGLTSLPPEKMTEIASDDFPMFLKAIKLYDMLAANRDIHSTQQTAAHTSLLAKVQQTIETVIANQQPTARMDFLQNTFTRLAGELNTKNEKKIEPAVLTNEKGLNTSETPAQVTNQHSIQMPMSKAEQLSLMLHSDGKPVSTDNLIKQFEAIIAKSQLTKTDGMQKLLIKLNPGNLGSLKIELIQKDEGIIAKIMTTTGSAKETLDTHLNGLKQAFAAQNIQVDRIEVAQQFTQQQRFQGRDQQSNQQHHPQQEEQEEKNNQHSGNFTLSLDEALLNMEV